MSETKLSSDEVPTMFAEWLLCMGCPAEKVPTVDKITDMCRGQYYMVWRSLMERAGPKDTIRRKKLQVFCNDIPKSQSNNVFGQRESIMPEELELWNHQKELHTKAEEARRNLTQDRQSLSTLLAKIGDKMAQRDLARCNLENAQRRAYLLQTLAGELSQKIASLKETIAIASAICGSGEETTGDVQLKLDRFLSGVLNEPRLPDPLASSSVASGAGDSSVSEEQQLLPLLQCAGDALCGQLYARRAALLRAFTTNTHPTNTTHRNDNRQTPQSVLAHTAALHCTLALEAIKNKVHYKQTHSKLVDAVTKLNNALSGESCELLVLRCEKAHSEARVNTMKALMEELTALDGEHAASDRATNVASLDRTIEMKREELKKVMVSLVTTERKIVSVKECLSHVFEWFASEAPREVARFRGVLDLPQESMASLRQFYESRREPKKVELSLELDASEASSVHCATDNVRFPDELRLYLSQFCLEKNRQLVLESGSKTWLSETVDSSIQGLHTKWLADGLSCSLLAPTDGVGSNLMRLADIVLKKLELGEMLRTPDLNKTTEIDITCHVQQEAAIIDRVKKRLKENLDLVHKINKIINTSRDNLTLWSENKLRKYILPTRTVDGISYKAYESWYLDNYTFEK